MANWNAVPLFRLLLPFTAGIITAIFFPAYSFPTWSILCLMTLVLLAFVTNRSLTGTYKNKWLFGLPVNLFFLFAGYGITLANNIHFNAYHYINYNTGNLTYVRLLEPCKDKPKSFKTVAEVLAVSEKGTWHKTEGKLIVYLAKDSSVTVPQYGNCLLIKGAFKNIEPPKNPAEFDYKNYLAHKGIEQQVYLKPQQWLNTGVNEGNMLIAFSYKLREKSLQVFKQYITSQQEYAVASALIAGYTDELDKDLVASYANTGVLHVLSVSGMHVGIIFIVFSYILSFMDKKRAGQIAKAVILLIFLWMYAMLTGFSAAVLRSAVMLSLVIIGNAIGRNTSIYNTLAVSAFALLLYNPYLITDVGFQLSYLAVFGIVWLQPHIYGLWEVENKYGDYVWKITAVSIAAQLVTCPLSLLYFHQFPNYFILANLAIIPISTIAIYGGIILLAVSPVPALCFYAGKALTLVLVLLNSTVRFFDGLPFSTLEHININELETIGIYIFIALTACLVFYRSARYLQMALIMAVVLFSGKLYANYNSMQQRKFIVYSIPKVSAFDFIDGEQNVLYADSVFINDRSSRAFHVKNNWTGLGLRANQMISNDNNIKSPHILVDNNFIQFYDKRIYVVKNAMPHFNKKIKVDWLIISSNAKIKVQDLVNSFAFGQLILDSSNSTYRVNSWKKECRELNVKCYCVTDSGAFNYSF